MKKLFAVLACTLSLSAFAAEPVPMVDVRLDIADYDARVRANVPDSIGTRIGKAYIASLNAAIQERGKLDILAVGQRATVVITEYYNPDDFLARMDHELDEEALPGRPMFNPSNPRTRDAMARVDLRPSGLPKKARIGGYVEFDGKRMPFQEIANAGGSMEWLADEVGRDAFRRVLDI